MNVQRSVDSQFDSYLTYSGFPGPSLKPKRINIRVLEHEAQLHGLPGERADIACRFSTRRCVRCESPKCSSESLKAKPGTGLPFASWISTFTPPAAEVAKFIVRVLAGEGERFGDEFTAFHRRVDGDEAVEAQRVAAQFAAGAGPVAFGGVELSSFGAPSMRGLCLDQMPGDVLMAVVPGAGALDAGRQEGFVPALERHAIAAGHEEALGDRPCRSGRWPSSAIRGARAPAAHACSPTSRARCSAWESRAAHAARDDTASPGSCRAPRRVNRHSGGPAGFPNVIKSFEVAVRMARGRRASSSSRPSCPGEVAPVGAILTAVRIPKGEVLRIKRTIRDHRRIRHRRPAQAVGRFQREQAFRRIRAHDGLVSRLGWRGRVFVFEDGG
jgi:hypothetical protein